MNSARLIILCILIKICLCTIEDIFNEWADKEKEPPKGHGAFGIVPFYLGSCDPIYKKDPDVWVNATSNIEKLNGTYNVKVDIFFSANIRCIRIEMELWVKLEDKIKKVIKQIIKNPCSHVVTFFLFKGINVTSSCTIKKGKYNYALEDVDKIVHRYLKSFSYARAVAKIEFFSVNGQFGCHMGVGDIKKRID